MKGFHTWEEGKSWHQHSTCRPRWSLISARALWTMTTAALRRTPASRIPDAKKRGNLRVLQQVGFLLHRLERLKIFPLPHNHRSNWLVSRQRTLATHLRSRPAGGYFGGPMLIASTNAKLMVNCAIHSVTTRVFASKPGPLSKRQSWEQLEPVLNSCSTSRHGSSRPMPG